MKLNHLNLITDDVAALADFFTRFFGFRLDAMRGKDAFAILTGEDGFSLNLMKPGRGERTGYPGNFHIGFLVRQPAEVDAKHLELGQAGLNVGELQDLTRGGSEAHIFYCHAPSGVLVEVGAYA